MTRYSQACENNKAPILEILKSHFKETTAVLEIGSGTGQHAVYFSQHLPHLYWQTSDQQIYHNDIIGRIAKWPQENLGNPYALDVTIDEHWQSIMSDDRVYDGIFSANTAHIMTWPTVQAMFTGICELLSPNGKLILYGPFNRDGEFTSQSNVQFHHNLQQQNVDMGIRDDRAISELAKLNKLQWIDDIEMPANNRILIFEKVPRKLLNLFS